MRQLIRLGVCCLAWSILSIALAEETIESIDVVGNKRVSSESVLFRLSSKVGGPYRPQIITQDIKTLWSTGLFRNIGVQAEDGDKGKKLKVIVLELPIISEVEYRGNSKVTKSSITDKVEEEHLTIAEGSVLDYKKANAIRALIKGLLDDAGLRFGKVEYVLENLDTGTSRLVFNVSEGSKVRIYNIDFTGNDVFTDRKLRWTMRKTKEHFWLSSWVTSHDIFKIDKFAEDVDKLKSKYWAKGYKDIFVGEPDMDITNHTSERQKKKNINRAKRGKRVREDLRMDLTIPIFEGESYTMGKFSVEGNDILPTFYYRRSFGSHLEEGDVYDLGKVNKWMSDVENLYNDRGYLHYSIRQEATIHENNVVDVHFIVKENDQFYVHRIGFAGNITTRDKVIRRQVLLREGDVFRLSIFRNSVLRVNQLGFFEVNQDPDIKMLPQENKVNVTIKGQETGVNELNFGLGFNEYRGSSGFLSFSTLNFLGRGQNLRVQATLGSLADTYDLSFTEPWLFDKPRGFSARLFNTRTSASAAGFIQESTGLQLGLSFRPFPFTTYGINYTFSEVNIPTVSTPDFEPINDVLTSSVQQSLRFDTTDHPFFPTKGRKLFGSYELAGWQTGGDALFYKVSAQAIQYIPAFAKTFMGFNFEANYMDTFESQRPLRHELFFMGGEESVRGYTRQGLGPVSFSGARVFSLRGDKAIQGNFEFIIPTSEQLRIVLFYDAGQVFGVNEDWFDTDIAQSTGIELRFRLPIFQAPMRIIYAYRLVETPIDPNKGGEPKFSIGTTF